MRYQQDLQVAIRERFRRLMIADNSDAGHEVRLTVDWIMKQPALMAILAEAEATETDPGSDEFFASFEGTGNFGWTSQTEEGRAALVWKLMQEMAGQDRAGRGARVGLEYSMAVARGNNINDNWRNLTERVLQPLFDYLTERIGDESSILYVLERYIRRVEWFDREELYDKAMADTRKAEDIYDTDLRRFLFSEGINMPFSQAESASGLSDVISELDSDDPFVGEVKLFDGEGRGKAHLGSGVNQAIQYANDYSKQVAYLIIINLSGRHLELPSDEGSTSWPPYVTIAGVRVYLIAVRARPTVSASKQGKPSPVTITLDNLVNPDSSGN